MSAAEDLYQACSTKRSRRTKADIEEIKKAIVAAGDKLIEHLAHCHWRISADHIDNCAVGSGPPPAANNCREPLRS